MAKKKKNGVHVHVHLPKEYVGAAGGAAGARVGGAAAGFLIANPLVAIVIIIVGIAAMMIFGGLTFIAVINKFMNIWMWCLALLIVIAFKPKNSIVMWAILSGFVFWMYGIYHEMVAMQNICNIPIIGWLTCTTWNIVTFLPKLWDLGITVFVAFAMIYIAEFIRFQISGKR